MLIAASAIYLRGKYGARSYIMAMVDNLAYAEYSNKKIREYRNKLEKLESP